MVSAAAAPPAFDLKSTAWTLTALRLQSVDLAALARALDERFGDAPGLFDNDPVAIDLSAVRQAETPIDFPALIALLRHQRMAPIAVQGGNAAQMTAALAAGLAEALDAAPAPPPAAPSTAAVTTEVATGVEVSHEVAAAREVPAAAAPTATPTLVIDKPLRSGQRVYARGGDLVMLALVSFGAEVIADGNIHVYAPLRGRAIAGAQGNTAARIYCTCLEPQLVSIAGIYRTTETELPPDVLGKPAQVWLDGEKIRVAPLGR